LARSTAICTSLVTILYAIRACCFFVIASASLVVIATNAFTVFADFVRATNIATGSTVFLITLEANTLTVTFVWFSSMTLFIDLM
jgi:hypothetical protein